MFIAAQIFIAISAVLFGLSCFAKGKKLLFIIQCVSSLLYLFYMLLMKAWVGAVVSFFDCVRVGIFYFIEKAGGSQKSKIWVASGLFVLAIVCAVFTWEGWYSVLPLTGTLTYIITLGISNLLIIKCATVFTAGCSVAYLVFAGSTFGVVCETSALVLALIGVVLAIINLKRKRQISVDK